MLIGLVIVWMETETGKGSNTVNSNTSKQSGAWWSFGRVDVFCPKGHGFDSHSSRHVGTLG